jgi:hypothetical protein
VRRTACPLSSTTCAPLVCSQPGAPGAPRSDGGDEIGDGGDGAGGGDDGPGVPVPLGAGEVADDEQAEINRAPTRK